jgi:hypothetical protein
MNPDTGELITNEERLKLLEEQRAKFVPVPGHLENRAKRRLAGKERTTIDMNSKDPLAKWARREKNRQANKAARTSRKKNRGR